MNITQRMYFGQSPLDKDRDRRIAFYGRVSTQHEAQVDALGNQMQWYDDQLRYHPNWQVINRYIDEGITGTSAKKRPAFMQIQTSLPLWFFVPHLQMAQAKRWYSRLWLPVQYAHGQPDPLLCSGAWSDRPAQLRCHFCSRMEARPDGKKDF